MKVIILPQKTSIMVDDEDYDRVNTFTWYSYRHRRTQYVRSTVWDAKRKKHLHFYLHRILTGAIPGESIDHINGNGLDNRRSNLRFATAHQNQSNKRLSLSSRTGFKGVSIDKRRRNTPFRSRIHNLGASIWLGYFHNARDSAIAYDEAANRLFGEYAKTNGSMGLLG